MRLPFLMLGLGFSMVAFGATRVVDANIPRYEPQSFVAPTGARFLTEDGSVAVIGYHDMEQMMDTLGARFSEMHPGVKFALTLKGTRTAPPALARGESAFAPMGATMSPKQLADYLTIAGREPVMFRVAHCSLAPAALSGPLAIIVHQDNPLTSLTMEEVANIFTGRTSGDLRPYGLAPETALGLFMRERALAGADFSPEFKGLPQSREVVQAVAADPQGIGFTAGMRVIPGVKTLALAPSAGAAPVEMNEENILAGRYPLDRYLVVYARQPIEPMVREFLRFALSREGQEVVARGSLGYLPLNSAETAEELTKLRNN